MRTYFPVARTRSALTLCAILCFALFIAAGAQAQGSSGSNDTTIHSAPPASTTKSDPDATPSNQKSDPDATPPKPKSNPDALPSHSNSDSSEKDDSSEKKDKKKEDIKLETLDPKTLDQYIDKKVQATGIVGDHEKENKRRFKFHMDNSTEILAIGDYPDIPHVRYTLHGTIAKEDGVFVMVVTSMERGDTGTSPWKPDPLLLGGLALIIAAVLTGVVLMTRNQANQQRMMMEQQMQDQRRQADARLEDERRRAAMGPGVGAAVGAGAGPGHTVVVGAQKDAKNQGVRDRTIVSIGSLEALKGPHAGIKFPLQPGENRIGRLKERQCDIVLDKDGEVSGYHGSVIVTLDGRALYKDESTNGSYINGQTVHHRQVEVQSGSDIEIGGSTLRLTLRSAAHGPGPAAPDMGQDPAAYQAAPAAAYGAPPPDYGFDLGAPAGRRSAPTIAVDQGAPAPRRPAAPTQEGLGAELEVVSGPDTGLRFQILHTVTTLGREDRDILLTDETVSRSHASLVVSDGRFVLKDDNSAHGTMVNGQRISSAGAELYDGDRITLGGGLTALVFHRIGA